MKSIILSLWLFIGVLPWAFASPGKFTEDNSVKVPYNGPRNGPDPQVIQLQGGDTIEEAVLITGLPIHITGTTIGYTDDYDEVCPYTGSTSPDVVYVWVCPADTCLKIDLCNGSDYDTKLYIYENGFTPGWPYVCNDDGCPGYYSQISERNFTGGNTYYIVIDGYGGDAGNYVLDIVDVIPQQGGDTIELATRIDSLPHHSEGTTWTYNHDYDEVCPYNSSVAPDVVYFWDCPADTAIDITLCNGSNYDTRLYIYENSYTPGAPFACNDDACPGYRSQILRLAVAGGNRYYIVIDGEYGNAGDYVLDVTNYITPHTNCNYVAPDFRFGRRPYNPYENWIFTTSDEDMGPFIVFDNYSFTNGVIESIDLWGIDLYYNMNWFECEENPTSFHVRFYPDADGQPDVFNVIYSYDITTTSQFLSSQVFDDIYYENFYTLNLPTPFTQLNGWMSIQGIGNGDSCVFKWSGSPRGDGLAYQEQNGQLIQLNNDMAFCLYGAVIENCLMCDMNIFTPFVPSNNGHVLFDLDVTNCGMYSTMIYAELYPTIGDCATGAPFDLNINRLMTPNLDPGATFVGQYFYAPGNVSGLELSNVAINIDIGPAIDIWYASCCDEFIFYNPFGRTGSPNAIWNTEFFEREGTYINLPVATALGDNYPNPFNATTTIPFDLTGDGNVSLKVYNLSGQLVEVLVDGYIQAGNHYAQWDASAISSGIYFYKLTASENAITKRMILLK